MQCIFFLPQIAFEFLIKRMKLNKIAVFAESTFERVLTCVVPDVVGRKQLHKLLLQDSPMLTDIFPKFKIRRVSTCNLYL